MAKQRFPDPDAVLAKHGIDTRFARSIPAVAFAETWLRIERTMEWRQIEGLPRRGKPPWRHAEAFNAFAAALCTADTWKATNPLIWRAQPPVVRMLDSAWAMAFAWFGHVRYDTDWYRMDDLTEAETAAARSFVSGLMRVDNAGNPTGMQFGTWFGDWSQAMASARAPFSEIGRDISRLLPPRRDG